MLAQVHLRTENEGIYIVGTGLQKEVETVEGFLRLSKPFKVYGQKELCTFVSRIRRENLGKVGINIGILAKLPMRLGLQEEYVDDRGGVEGMGGEGRTVVNSLLGMVESEGTDGTMAAGLKIIGVLTEDYVKFFGGFVKF